LKGGFVIALFLFTIFAAYAYAFYLGSIWIRKEFWNTTFNRAYTSGDIMSCFFGIVFGMFSLGIATPNIQAVAEGKAAGKLAFDIIDRKPAID
jgi:hypothetical protein